MDTVRILKTDISVTNIDEVSKILLSEETTWIQMHPSGLIG